MQTQAQSEPAPDSTRKPERPDATVWLYAAAVPLFLLFAGMELRKPVLRLLGFVADDAFYYLGIARHIAASGTCTFDGINVTNGFHPAWLAILSVCALVVTDRVLLLKLALALCLALHAATSILVVDIVRRLGAPRLAWTAGALWLINPAALLVALNGVEAPLALFALAISIRVFLIRIVAQVKEGEPYRPQAADLATFGASLAFVFWARTDGIILAAAAVAVVAALARRQTSPPPFPRGEGGPGGSGPPPSPTGKGAGGLGGPGGVGPPPSPLGKGAGGLGAPEGLGPPPSPLGKGAGGLGALLVAATFLLCILPWLLISLALVGTVRQDSGAMKMIWASVYYGGPGPKWIQLFYEYCRDYWLGNPVTLMLGGPAFQTPAYLAIGILLFGIAYGASVSTKRAPAPLRWTSWWLLTFVLISSGFYSVAMTDSQRWYCAEPMLVFWLLGAAWLPRAAESFPQLAKLRGAFAPQAAIFALMAALMLKSAFRTPDLYPWQRDVYVSQPRFAEHVPPDQRIGCFNAGIPGYFYDNVIDLDGLVNHNVVQFWAAHRFTRYIDIAHVHYIADEKDALTRGVIFSSPSDPFLYAERDEYRLSGWKLEEKDGQKRYLVEVSTSPTAILPYERVWVRR